MQVNQQVKGTYCGTSFVGVISEMRLLSVKTDGCFEFIVNLAKPITVFGKERGRICVYVKFDGTPSSYTNFSDFLQSA